MSVRQHYFWHATIGRLEWRNDCCKLGQTSPLDGSKKDEAKEGDAGPRQMTPEEVEQARHEEEFGQIVLVRALETESVTAHFADKHGSLGVRQMAHVWEKVVRDAVWRVP